MLLLSMKFFKSFKPQCAMTSVYKLNHEPIQALRTLYIYRNKNKKLQFMSLLRTQKKIHVQETQVRREGTQFFFSKLLCSNQLRYFLIQIYIQPHIFKVCISSLFMQQFSRFKILGPFLSTSFPIWRQLISTTNLTEQPAK